MSVLKWMPVIAGGLILAACSGTQSEPNPEFACHVATYAAEDGRLLDIGALSADALRWRTLDGQTGRVSLGLDGIWAGNTGWTDNPSPAQIRFEGCPGDAVSLTGIDELTGTYSRQTPEIMDTVFQSGELTLAGRLVLPAGQDRVPVAVLVHGSEDYSARQYYHFQRLLPAMGIGVFVYDKRGTGGSDGRYSQDFDLLADDAVAALSEARRLAGDRASRVGYQGGSQGGWIAPLAATRSDADFVIASFGMLESPLTEDAEQAQREIRDLGYDADVQARVRELTDATGVVLASDFEAGADELKVLKDQYRDEEWFELVEGEVSGEMLRNPLWAFKFVYENIIRADTSWGHDPMPVIRDVDVPVLWVVAAEDWEAPPEGTIDALAQLQSEGRDVAYAVFPDTDHGIINFIETDEGRESIRYAEGYFNMIGDWILTGDFQAAYGDAVLAPSPALSSN